MRVEVLLSFFGILLTFITYAVLLAAFTMVEEHRNLYVLGAIGALVCGTMMLGIAKIINQQNDVLRVMNDVRRSSRVQTKVLHDMAEGPAEAAPNNLAAGKGGRKSKPAT